MLIDTFGKINRLKEDATEGSPRHSKKDYKQSFHTFINSLQTPVKAVIRRRHVELSPLCMLIGELVQVPVGCDFC